MNRKIRKILSGIVILTVSAVFAAGQSLIDQKLVLEKSIQERAERIIEKIIGSRDVVVLVNVELIKEEKSAKKTEKPVYSGMTTSDEEYLPGITYSYVPIKSESKGVEEIIISKIVVSVTVDKNVQPAIVERIRKEVNALLGLNPIRGDVVDVQKIEFAKKEVKWYESIISTAAYIYWTIGLILLAVFMFGPLRNFFRTVVRAMEMRIESDTRAKGYEDAMRGGPGGGAPAGLSGPLELTLDRKRPQLGGGEEYRQARKFNFINRDNFKNLVYLLKNENPGKIAVISSYIQPEYASNLIGALSPELQSKVALSLTTPKIIDPEEVEKIEKELKQKIDYLVGGEEYFLGLLDTVDRAAQENILKSIEDTNPALSSKLRQSLFFFEDIIILDRPVLQRVIRELQRQGISLALAMKGASEDLKLRVMDTLTEGARAMLAEQIDLLGEVAEKRVVEEQKMISNIVKELEKNGDILIDRSKKYKVLEQKSDSIIPEPIDKIPKSDSF